MNVPDIMIPALDLIIAQRAITTKEGKLQRIIYEVSEVGGKERDTFLLNTLFSYDPKEGKIESKVLNGKIIREISEFTGLTIKEIDEEIHKRELVLELMMQYNLTQKDIHKFVQDYYKRKYDTLRNLHDEIVALLEERGIEAKPIRKSGVEEIKTKAKRHGLLGI